LPEQELDLEELCEANPLYLVLKVREAYLDSSRDCVRLVANPSQDYAWIHGGVHGGYISALTILASELAASSSVGGDVLLVGVESSIIFLRQVEVPNVIEVQSCVSYRTQRIIGVESSVRCGGHEIAKGITMFLVEERG